MVEVNRITTPANTRWKLVDRETGAANHEIDWRFRVGDQVKIRLVNEMDSDHPMHHPFHVHGAGRFVVLARDGVEETNLVWKDTVLVRTGETVDILLDVTNPGTLDGALPHRRAPRERDDVQLQRRPRHGRMRSADCSAPRDERKGAAVGLELSRCYLPDASCGVMFTHGGATGSVRPGASDGNAVLPRTILTCFE